MPAVLYAVSTYADIYSFTYLTSIEVSTRLDPTTTSSTTSPAHSPTRPSSARATTAPPLGAVCRRITWHAARATRSPPTPIPSHRNGNTTRQWPGQVAVQTRTAPAHARMPGLMPALPRDSACHPPCRRVCAQVMVLGQIRTLFTALLARLFTTTVITRTQWFTLLILIIGVLCARAHTRTRTRTHTRAHATAPTAGDGRPMGWGAPQPPIATGGARVQLWLACCPPARLLDAENPACCAIRVFHPSTRSGTIICSAADMDLSADASQGDGDGAGASDAAYRKGVGFLCVAAASLSAAAASVSNQLLLQESTSINKANFYLYSVSSTAGHKGTKAPKLVFARSVDPQAACPF